MKVIRRSKDIDTSSMVALNNIYQEFPLPDKLRKLATRKDYDIFAADKSYIVRYGFMILCYNMYAIPSDPDSGERRIKFPHVMTEIMQFAVKSSHYRYSYSQVMNMVDPDDEEKTIINDYFNNIINDATKQNAEQIVKDDMKRIDDIKLRIEFLFEISCSNKINDELSKI